MKKIYSTYVCQSCGYASPRWAGKCPNCSAWNSFVEELVQTTHTRKETLHSSNTAVTLAQVNMMNEHRIVTTLTEFDRVLGGGVVFGSAVLLGGDPGIGKSTLMLQLASLLTDKIVLYISGEESAQQIKLRAERLHLKPNDKFLVLAETNLEVIREIIQRSTPDVLIVDSIQTMYRPELENAPGSVGQVRESTAEFIRIAKKNNIPVFLVGHVTKEGVIAGPKVIEHMVDTVLQFEGERHYTYRIVRAIKNRFGSTNEIGVFEMKEHGLQEVLNPSEVFLSERTTGTTGSTVVPSIEGSRPILLEVQALVTPSSYNVPQRNTTGFDYRRLGLLIAVLEKRLGIQLGQYDVFVNIAGGVRVEEPAVDLGITLSIISSLRDRPVNPLSVAVGEIGLGGEIRTVSHIEKRAQEAMKLGFTRCVVPKSNLKNMARIEAIELVGIARIEEAVEAAFD